MQVRFIFGVLTGLEWSELKNAAEEGDVMRTKTALLIPQTIGQPWG